jgi:hypothetical protein
MALRRRRLALGLLVCAPGSAFADAPAFAADKPATETILAYRPRGEGRPPGLAMTLTLEPMAVVARQAYTGLQLSTSPAGTELSFLFGGQLFLNEIVAVYGQSTAGSVVSGPRLGRYVVGAEGGVRFFAGGLGNVFLGAGASTSAPGYVTSGVALDTGVFAMLLLYALSAAR